jgi:phosphohistidine phosphatase
MKLYLVQHGKALSKEDAAHRPLSMEGKKETRKIARFLKKRNIKTDFIWHSGKARAVETAQIISWVIEHEKISEREDLNPSDPVEKFREEVERLNADLMIVGHLPFLQKLASLLLTKADHHSLISFKNSGVVCLEKQKDWELAWSMTPNLV